MCGRGHKSGPKRRKAGRPRDRSCWAEGRDERVAEFAAELVRLNVDVIVTSSNPAIETAMKATSQIPIVAAAMTDAMSMSIIETLARPGWTVTGLTIQTDERFELLREIVPDLHDIVVMGCAPHQAFQPAICLGAKF